MNAIAEKTAMQLPDFRIGDTVMLQSGSKHMTITSIDDDAQTAICDFAVETDFSCREFPLRALVRLSDQVNAVQPGDQVMCRSTFQYMAVLNYDEATKVATCLGGDHLQQSLPLSRLVKLHLRYD